MAEKKFSVTLKEIIDEFHLETIHLLWTLQSSLLSRLR